MFRKLFFLVLTLSGTALWAQNAISGYVHREDTEAWGSKVYLSEIKMKDLPDYRHTRLVASTTVGKDGYFSFERKLIADKDAVYRLHMDRIKEVLGQGPSNDRLLILSRKDSVQFRKGKRLFGPYDTTNKTDTEWQSLRKYEAALRNREMQYGDSTAMAYAARLNGYTKDSLRILMVKLIGIHELENKKLLDEDIAKNPDHYVALLEELKVSDLDPAQYLFLEKKLAYLTTEVVARKYRTSRILNVVLVVAMGGLVFLLLMGRKQNLANGVDLSRQEQKVQRLILAGKSNKEIANELFISISTVKTHITNIYGKLNVANRGELFKKAKN
ncbi:response regulator transcription factor [Spongiimicrobium sp. 2-473A-2-J]|uniref:response regulator transcription factor n=1 Tax=Eudoraea algarum TaxID=3417568 RepID=UPI003D35AF6A